MKNTANIAKRDSKQQLVLCEVFVPNEIDSQNEFASPETLEKAAHAFNANGNQNNVTIMHDGIKIDAAVVESYIAKKDDPLFKPGTWVAVIKVRDPDIWQAIEKGALRGVSFEGTGNRRETTLNGVKATEMIDLDITTISLVDRPASRRPFKMTKSDNQNIGQVFENIARTVESIGKAQKALLARLEKQDELLKSLGTDKSGRVVRKADPAPQQDPEVGRLLRKRARLQERLEAVWEDPTQYPEVDELDLRRRISKAEDRLYERGYEPKRATLDTGSAFYQRGGSSKFLVASPSTIDEIFGVRRNGVSKSDENDIEVENNLVL